MDATFKKLEGIGHGRIERIVVGKLKIGVDLLEAIEEFAFPSADGSLPLLKESSIYMLISRLQQWSTIKSSLWEGIPKGMMTSIKDVITIGMIEKTDIRAALDPLGI